MLGKWVPTLDFCEVVSDVSSVLPIRRSGNTSVVRLQSSEL
jgi:hypothetical protein